MSFESQISNYYEKLVVDDLSKRPELDSIDESELIDIACVALNQLPARYYRYSVDMAFYLAAQETQAMEDEVSKAVTYALSFVQSNKKTQ
ncbi:late competence development ComFB family protein [Reinekea marina]|uniref:Late competence development ComFB family protein n=1 Tax=Reinekea marina TaxID=1310421 RepID=A0ABV7WLF9_9GAMM|nr:late competence development ComFB family protein [Reinekea marina]MBU2865007.1 late competence development ComFB family protein [Reinekea forsetii]MDN3648370.1 late competence development ComFB family protein [Reinekea marina]